MSFRPHYMNNGRGMGLCNSSLSIVDRFPKLSEINCNINIGNSHKASPYGIIANPLYRVCDISMNRVFNAILNDIGCMAFSSANKAPSKKDPKLNRHTLSLATQATTMMSKKTAHQHHYQIQTIPYNQLCLMGSPE